MVTQELLEYIKKARTSGQTDQQIKVDLMPGGWNEADLDEALKLTNVPTPSNVPNPNISIESNNTNTASPSVGNFATHSIPNIETLSQVKPIPKFPTLLVLLIMLGLTIGASGYVYWDTIQELSVYKSVMSKLGLYQEDSLSIPNYITENSLPKEEPLNNISNNIAQNELAKNNPEAPTELNKLDKTPSIDQASILFETTAKDCGTISYSDLMYMVFGNGNTSKVPAKSLASIKCANDSLLKCSPAKLTVEGTTVNIANPNQKDFKVDSFTYKINTGTNPESCTVNECKIPTKIIKNRSISEKQNLLFTLIGFGKDTDKNDVYDPVTKSVTKDVCSNTENSY